MKKNLMLISCLTTLMIVITISCQTSSQEIEETVKIENNLQSVSYFQDTLDRNPEDLLTGIRIFNKAINEIRLISTSSLLIFLIRLILKMRVVFL